MIFTGHWSKVVHTTDSFRHEYMMSIPAVGIHTDNSAILNRVEFSDH